MISWCCRGDRPPPACPSPALPWQTESLACAPLVRWKPLKGHNLWYQPPTVYLAFYERLCFNIRGSPFHNATPGDSRGARLGRRGGDGGQDEPLNGLTTRGREA